MKIALIYDWIATWGGAERVLLSLHEMFPKADWYTAYYDKKNAPWAEDFTIHTSFIQKIPINPYRIRWLTAPLFPFAFESFNFTNYDLVISCTSYFAKSVITRPETKHICYLLTPTRYLWKDPYIHNNFLMKSLLNPYIKYLKKWDYAASQRPDQYIAISETVKKRIKKYYHRDSEVIYPPFDITYCEKVKSEIQNANFQTNSKFEIESSKYYLMVSRLESYKNVDLVVSLFKQLNKKLIIIGTGSQENRLKSIASANITFFNRLSDQQLGQLYTHAQALIMPQEEDFGYTALEAQFFGCPVISYRKSGASESIIEDRTGIFFDQQKSDSLQKALAKYEDLAYTLHRSTLKDGLKNIERFSKERFKTEFMHSIASSTKL